MITDNNTGRVNQEPESHSETTVLLWFLLLWQTIFKVSDRAILLLLKFFKLFIIYLSKAIKADVLLEFARAIPETMYSIHKSLKIKKDDFVKYGVCPKCKTLYTMDQCFKRKPSGEMVSAKCSHIRFPRHPHQSRRRPCGDVLSKTMRSKSGKNFLYPKELYCYKKLSDSLEAFIKKPNFMEKCVEWRKRSNCLEDDVLGDCYEGKVWKDFQYVDGQPFLSVPNTLGLMLNIDWFQPTKHGLHSVGVIYMVVMNLPRDERFKPENVITVGIIPGPKEPKLHVNTFLQPLVDELIDLWDGILLRTKSGGHEMFRAALLALSCDIPASRKCGGFVGHGAKRGK